jgi:hypothetical protein
MVVVKKNPKPFSKFAEKKENKEEAESEKIFTKQVSQFRPCLH